MNIKLANPIRDEFRLSGRPARTVTRTRTVAPGVTYTKVDQRVWRTALKLAKGDALRIKVLSPEDVLVLNARH